MPSINFECFVSLGYRIWFIWSSSFKSTLNVDAINNGVSSSRAKCEYSIALFESGRSALLFLHPTRHSNDSFVGISDSVKYLLTDFFVCTDACSDACFRAASAVDVLTRVPAAAAFFGFTVFVFGR